LQRKRAPESEDVSLATDCTDALRSRPGRS